METHTKCITIDFYNTLYLYPDDKVLKPTINTDLKNMIKSWKDTGYDIIIVVDKSKESKEDLLKIIKDSNILVDDIKIHENFESKIEFLKKLKPGLHVDDDIFVTHDLLINNIDCILPPVHDRTL
jgi:hypothetical protein